MLIMSQSDPGAYFEGDRVGERPELAQVGVHRRARRLGDGLVDGGERGQVLARGVLGVRVEAGQLGCSGRTVSLSQVAKKTTRRALPGPSVTVPAVAAPVPPGRPGAAAGSGDRGRGGLPGDGGERPEAGQLRVAGQQAGYLGGQHLGGLGDARVRHLGQVELLLPALGVDHVQRRRVVDLHPTRSAPRCCRTSIPP